MNQPLAYIFLTISTKRAFHSLATSLSIKKSNPFKCQSYYFFVEQFPLSFKKFIQSAKKLLHKRTLCLVGVVLIQ